MKCIENVTKETSVSLICQKQTLLVMIFHSAQIKFVCYIITGTLLLMTNFHKLFPWMHTAKAT